MRPVGAELSDSVNYVGLKGVKFSQAGVGAHAPCAERHSGNRTARHDARRGDRLRHSPVVRYNVSPCSKPDLQRSGHRGHRGRPGRPGRPGQLPARIPVACADPVNESSAPTRGAGAAQRSGPGRPCRQASCRPVRGPADATGGSPGRRCSRCAAAGPSGQPFRCPRR